MSLACALVGLLNLQNAAPASVIGRSHGAFEVDGAISAAGPGYGARFSRGGIEFLPALGASGPRDCAISFALESVRRGDAPILEHPPAVPPAREGNFVRFARPDGIVESYESRVDGVEQTFRFESLPAGTGDLVVRGRVTTALRASDRGDSKEGIRFEAPGFGAVAWGAVTGIDAAGSRASGGLRFDGTHLELTLPGAFVDRAVFPLVLDPLIGATTVVTGGDDRDPDVAYDATNDLYLVVWQRFMAGAFYDVLGQRFSSTGALVGPTIGIALGAPDTRYPSVANVNATDRFLVAYVEDATTDAVRARAVSALDGSVSGEVTIVLGPIGPPLTVDVGGDSDGSEYAFVVWSSIGIRIARVTLPPIGNPVPSAPHAVTLDWNDRAPAISKHGGIAGHFLLVWEHGPGNGVQDVHARVVDLSGVEVTPVAVVAADPVAHEANPDGATQDGYQFAIVYEKHNSGTAGTGDIACRTSTYLFGPGYLGVSGETILAGGIWDQIEPAIDFAGSKYLIAWSAASLFGSGFQAFMTAISPFGCVPCEPVVTLDASAATADRRPEIAAMRSGSATAGDGAMVVWESFATSGDVKAQRVEAIGAGGAVTALGGGCGGGGTAGVDGPVALGNASFAFTLSGAGGPPVAFALGATQLNFACGGCTLVPPLGFLLPGPAPLALPIPCDLSLLGGTVYAQWIVLVPGSCPLAPALSLSDAVSAVIGV